MLPEKETTTTTTLPWIGSNGGSANQLPFHTFFTIKCNHYISKFNSISWALSSVNSEHTNEIKAEPFYIVNMFTRWDIQITISFLFLSFINLWKKYKSYKTTYYWQKPKLDYILQGHVILLLLNFKTDKQQSKKTFVCHYYQGKFVGVFPVWKYFNSIVLYSQIIIITKSNIDKKKLFSDECYYWLLTW